MGHESCAVIHSYFNTDRPVTVNLLLFNSLSASLTWTSPPKYTTCSFPVARFPLNNRSFSLSPSPCTDFSRTYFSFSPLSVISQSAEVDTDFCNDSATKHCFPPTDMLAMFAKMVSCRQKEARNGFMGDRWFYSLTFCEKTSRNHSKHCRRHRQVYFQHGFLLTRIYVTSLK